MLSLRSLAPGEDQLVTRAGSLSTGSQKVICWFGECPAVTTPIPSLDNDLSNDRASFHLRSNSVAEIMAMADCDTDD